MVVAGVVPEGGLSQESLEGEAVSLRSDTADWARDHARRCHLLGSGGFPFCRLLLLGLPPRKRSGRLRTRGGGENLHSWLRTG